MHKTIILALVLLVSLLPACKKQKALEKPGNKETKIGTVDLSFSPSATVYGVDLTFKVKFEDIGQGNKAVGEYGIVYLAWISNLSNKIPVKGTGTLVLFTDTPAAGKTIEKKVTLTYEQFNDANYRAFVKLKDGTYIYGEVKYFGVS